MRSKTRSRLPSSSRMWMATGNRMCSYRSGLLHRYQGQVPHQIEPIQRTPAQRMQRENDKAKAVPKAQSQYPNILALDGDLESVPVAQRSTEDSKYMPISTQIVSLLRHTEDVHEVDGAELSRNLMNYLRRDELFSTMELSSLGVCDVSCYEQTEIRSLSIRSVCTRNSRTQR